MTRQLKYTGTQTIVLEGDAIVAVEPTESYISSSGTAHYENCSVVTRMLTAGGMLRSAARRPISTEKALAGIKSGTYADCAACTKIRANREAEYAENAKLIATETSTSTPDSQEEITMTETTATTALTNSATTVYTAMLAGAKGSAAEISEASGVTPSSTKRALVAMLTAGLITIVESNKRGVAATYFLTGQEPVEAIQVTTEPVKETVVEPVTETETVAVETPAQTEEPKVETAEEPKAEKILAPTAIGGKQMTVILPYLIAHPGEYFTVKQIEEALSLPDYPRGACFRLVKSNVGVQQEARSDNKLRFGYTGVASAK